MPSSRQDILPPFPLTSAIQTALTAPDREAFHRTTFYRTHGAAFEDWITAIRSGQAESTPAAGDARRLRLVHWNIEQGKAWDRLVSAVGSNPFLRGADLWTLNEVDIGTARSGNRNVVRDLGRHLNLHWVFIPNYLELTKGLGGDRHASGENAVGLHGTALLSRWPFVEAASAPLPDCFDYFAFPEEKRYGCRRILWATVRHPNGDFRLATAHLEVRAGPRCRARQMAAALTALPDGPCWFAGDFNTHTFRRGGVVQTVQEFLRLQFTTPQEIDRQVIEAWQREPLFERLVGHQFAFRPWNDSTPTALQVLSGVDELAILPPPARRWVTRQLRLGERTLRMRLDWIAARGPWIPEAGGRAAWTVVDVGPEGVAASDHAPIGIDAAWPGAV